LAKQEDDRQQIAQTIGEITLQDMAGKLRDDPVKFYEKLGGSNNLSKQMITERPGHFTEGRAVRLRLQHQTR